MIKNLVKRIVVSILKEISAPLPDGRFGSGYVCYIDGSTTFFFEGEKIFSVPLVKVTT